ncbi:hypothetical protein [Demequina soli]|uniref:hypothetical protein n=1 Tax=Demequina soli TaxID=1638987 RepID=UPI0007840681|nr:hypothetical protein [Demequina soli]
MSSEQTPEAGDGRTVERDRIVAYLAFHERSARAKAEAADSEDSRAYQTTIANAMQAMREAIAGGFHWKADL